jgi:hypothetical protein
MCNRIWFMHLAGLISSGAFLGCPGPNSGMATIGPNGGTVQLKGGPSVQIPKGALAANTTITIAAAKTAHRRAEHSTASTCGPRVSFREMPIACSK